MSKKDYVEVVINGDDYLLSIDELYNIIHEYEIYRDIELEENDIFISNENMPLWFQLVCYFQPSHVCDITKEMNYVG